MAELERVPLPSGTLLNINVPGAPPKGVEVARLGKRIYRDELSLVDQGSGGRRLYRIYGDASYERDETGTDLAAVAAGRIAVTPIHFDLTDHDGLDGARALRPGPADRAGRTGGDRALSAGGGHDVAGSASPSCAASSTTTAIATTSSTIPRSATTTTTRCSTSCARSRPSIPS